MLTLYTHLGSYVFWESQIDHHSSRVLTPLHWCSRAGVVDAAIRVWTLNTVTGDGDGTATGPATVVSAPPIRVLVTSELGYCTIEALAIAPSGHLYTAGADETVRLW